MDPTEDLRRYLSTKIKEKKEVVHSRMTWYKVVRYGLDILQVLVQATVATTSASALADKLGNTVLPYITASSAGASILVIALKKIFVKPTQQFYDLQTILKTLEQLELDLISSQDLEKVKSSFHEVLMKLNTETVNEP